GSIPHFHEAVQLDPTKDLYLDYLGLAYWKTGDPESAVAYLKKASDAAPKAWLWKLDLARVLADIGQNHAALKAFDDALALSPGHPEIVRARDQLVAQIRSQAGAQASQR